MTKTSDSSELVIEQVHTLILNDCIERTGTLSFVFSILFAIYGFTSISFIQKLDPNITLLSNIIPRIIFNTIPFLLLGIYLKKSKATDGVKLIIWVSSFSTILHVTAWIHIWPISLNRSAEVLPLVNAANLFLIAIVYSVVAPPARYFLIFSVIFITIFVVPLVVIAYFSKDLAIFKLILNDTSCAMLSSMYTGKMIDTLRCQVIKLKVEKESEARQFLGNYLSDAIFKNKRHLLNKIECEGFVVCMDVRNSTYLLQNFTKQWLGFQEAYFELFKQEVQRFSGYIQKTTGDCHIINFGVMDYGVSLADIPGIENELARAEERRLLRASRNVFNFLDHIIPKFELMALSHIPERNIHLGVGVDKGILERAIKGGSLDVNGDPVNCSERLQSYSKKIRELEELNCSLVVISPFASDYLENCNELMRIQTNDFPIPNYPGIKWVLVKSFQYAQTQMLKQAA